MVSGALFVSLPSSSIILENSYWSTTLVTQQPQLLHDLDRDTPSGIHFWHWHHIESLGNIHPQVPKYVCWRGLRLTDSSQSSSSLVTPELDGWAPSCIPGSCEKQHLAVDSQSWVRICLSWSWLNFSLILWGLYGLWKEWSEVQKVCGGKTEKICGLWTTEQWRERVYK